MTNHPIVVTLPGEVYDPLSEIAAAKDQTLEQIVVEQLRSVTSVALPQLPADEESELVAFKFLTDDTLRGIAREQMPHDNQDRIQVLMDKNNLGEISTQEHGELAELVERGQRLMLRKAWAAGILMERGHKITGEDMAPESD